MRIGTDLDGVVVDWVGSVLRELGLPPDAGVTEWDSIFDVTGMKPSELFAFCKRAGVFLKADPVEGAIAGLEALFAAGHDVQFVTSRPEWATAETHEWLDAHLAGADVDDLEERTHIIQGTNKSVVKCDVYLDDSPHVLKDMRKRRQCIVRYERPWNKNCKSWRYSVADWPAFVSLIGSLS